MLGSTIIILTPIRRSTRMSSSREKPPSPFPTGNITIVVLAARCAVSPIGNDIVGTMVAGALVDIRLAPGVGRHLFLEIRPVPAVRARGSLRQGGQTFLCRRIAPHIEPESIQRGSEKLDLRFRRLRRRLFFL